MLALQSPEGVAVALYSKDVETIFLHMMGYYFYYAPTQNNLSVSFDQLRFLHLNIYY